MMSSPGLHRSLQAFESFLACVAFVVSILIMCLMIELCFENSAANLFNRFLHALALVEDFLADYFKKPRMLGTFRARVYVL